MKSLFRILIALFIGQNFAYSQEDTKRNQSFPVLQFNYYNFSPAAIEKPNNAGKIKISELQLRLQAPIELKKDKSYLLQRLEYNYMNPTFRENKGFPKIQNNELHAIAYSIGLMQSIGNGWKITGIIAPTLASDFKASISLEDFVLQSTLILGKQVSPIFEYGFGVSYNTRFGEPLVMPVFLLNYQKEKWKIKAILPTLFESYYHFNKSKLGILIQVHGNAFSFHKSIESNYNLNKLYRSRINIGPSFESKLYKHLYINTSAGLSFRNKIISIDTESDNKLDLSTDNKFFFNVGFSIKY